MAPPIDKRLGNGTEAFAKVMELHRESAEAFAKRANYYADENPVNARRVYACGPCGTALRMLKPDQVEFCELCIVTKYCSVACKNWDRRYGSHVLRCVVNNAYKLPCDSRPTIAEEKTARDAAKKSLQARHKAQRFFPIFQAV